MLVIFTLRMMIVPALLSLTPYPGTPLDLLLKILRREIRSDSSFCMNFAWDAFRAGHRVYETVLFSGVAKFQYPISSLFLYKLAALLHIPGGTLIHRLILLSFPVTLLLTSEVFLAALPASEPLSRRQRLLVRGCILALGLIFYPVVSGVVLGQIQTLQVLLWTLVVLFWIRGRRALSGICLALICMLKPQFAIFLLWAALRRHWSFFLPFLVTILGIQAISIAAFGWHNQIEYLAALDYLNHHGEGFWDNQSVNGLLQRLTGNADPAIFDLHGFPPFNPIVYLGTVISSALMISVGLALPMLRRWSDTTLDLLFFGLIATIASPIAWDHHYGYFFAATIYMLAVFLFHQRRVPWGFQIGFLFLTTSAGVGYAFMKTRLTVLTSFELFAGLGMLCSIALLAEKTSRARVQARQVAR